MMQMKEAVHTAGIMMARAAQDTRELKLEMQLQVAARAAALSTVY